MNQPAKLDAAAFPTKPFALREENPAVFLFPAKSPLVRGAAAAERIRAKQASRIIHKSSGANSYRAKLAPGIIQDAPDPSRPRQFVALPQYLAPAAAFPRPHSRFPAKGAAADAAGLSSRQVDGARP